MAINRTSPKKGKVVDIPTVPTVGTATAGAESATVAYTAATIGGPATTFTALSNPGSFTGSGSSSPITVTGLTAGTAYTFTVRGNNATGSSEYSSASNSVTPTTNTSYESIATYTVGAGGTSTVTFSSIPSTYKHLQVRIMARNAQSGGGTTQNLNMTVNNDSGGNYTFHQLQGDGSSAGSYGEGLGRTNCIQVVHVTTSTAASGIFGVGIIDIIDYTNTNKLRTIRSLRGQDQNGSGTIALHSYLYNSTTAISRLDFTAAGGDLVQYSSFALYGVKG